MRRNVPCVQIQPSIKAEMRLNFKKSNLAVGSWSPASRKPDVIGTPRRPSRGVVGTDLSRRCDCGDIVVTFASRAHAEKGGASAVPAVLGSRVAVGVCQDPASPGTPACTPHSCGLFGHAWGPAQLRTGPGPDALLTVPP